MTDSELTELYKQHSGALLRYCGFRLASRADAEDATSEVFARLIADADRVRSDKHRQWLFGTARHVCTDRLREGARQTRELPPELGYQPDEPWVDPRVRAAVAELTLGQQEVLFLRVFEDLPFAEVGRVSGRAEAAVRVQYHRAVRQLRKSLEGVDRCLGPSLEPE